MQIIGIPTEQTTAATDLILALLSLATAFFLSRRGGGLRNFRVRIWTVVFCSLAVVGFGGAVAHGLVMSETLNGILWHLINLSLAAMITLFLTAFIHDLFSEAAARKWMLRLAILALLFLLVTLLFPDSFLVFVLFESAAMLVALVGYSTACLKRSLPGSGLIATAILLTLAAGAVQATGNIRLQCIWLFDHNGAFHLIQMLALPFFAAGIFRGLESN